MKINRELLKGSTNMIILSLLEHENMYGYQIIKRLTQKSNNIFEFKEGTLYPILHNLEKNGFIISYWEEVSKKKRKYYSITDKGKEQLKKSKKEWKIFNNGIWLVLGGEALED